MSLEQDILDINADITKINDNLAVATDRLSQAKEAFSKVGTDVTYWMKTLDAIYLELRASLAALAEKLNGLRSSNLGNSDLLKAANVLRDIDTRLDALEIELFALRTNPPVPAQPSQPLIPSLPMPADEAALERAQRQSELWTSVPFDDIGTFLKLYLNATDIAPATPYAKDDLKAIVRDYFIPLMTVNHMEAMRQAVVLIYANDIEITTMLLRQLMVQMDTHAATMPREAYAMLADILNALPKDALEPANQADLTEFIRLKIDAILSPDIFLSCQLIQAMIHTLQRIAMLKDARLLTYHQERLRESVKTLNNRLAAVKVDINNRANAEGAPAEDKHRAALLSNLEKALKKINSLLAHGNLLDERTQGQRYIDRLLQVGALLMQATEVAVQWYGAVATFGVAAPGVIMSTVNFAVDLWRQGTNVYHYYRDNKEYFNALLQWRKVFEEYQNEADQIKYIKTLRRSKADVVGQQYWRHPAFSEGILELLMARYVVQPVLRPAILGFLHAYFKRPRLYQGMSADEQQQATQRLRRQLSCYLLQIDDSAKKDEALQVHIPYPNKALQDASVSLIASISGEDKAFYEQQKRKAITPQYSLPKEAWRKAYPGDVWLYEVILPKAIERKAFTVTEIRILNQLALGHPEVGYRISHWGEALVQTFDKTLLEECQYTTQAKLQLNFNFNAIGVHIDINSLPWKEAETNPILAQTLQDLVKESAKSGAANVGQIMLNPIRQGQILASFDHVIDKTFNMIVNQTTAIYFSSETIGTSFSHKATPANTVLEPSSSRDGASRSYAP